MTSPSDPTPRYEPGGGKLIAVAAILVVAALAGMTWSFFSRQHAPQDAPPIKERFLPPSERHAPPPAKDAVPSTEGFAQPSGCAGAEPCSTKPPLRPAPTSPATR